MDVLEEFTLGVNGLKENTIVSYVDEDETSETSETSETTGLASEEPDGTSELRRRRRGGKAPDLRSGSEEPDGTSERCRTNGGGKAPDIPFIMFMAHIAHSEFDYLEDELKLLEVDYVISAEVETYEHFHFLVRMSAKRYHAFSKHVFKDKYGLRGRAIKGQPRQYGKKKEDIQSLKDALAYTIKDKNWRSNMTKKQIENILKKKIEEVKNTKNKDYSQQLKDELLKYMDTMSRYTPEYYPSGSNNQYYCNGEYEDKFLDREIRIKIVDFMREKKITIRKSLIDMYYYFVISYSENPRLKKTSGYIIDSLYCLL